MTGLNAEQEAAAAKGAEIKAYKTVKKDRKKD